LIFSTVFIRTFLILRRTERDIIKNVTGLHVKYPLFLTDFNGTCMFSTDFLKTKKKYQHIEFHENLSSGSRDFSMRTDGLAAVNIHFLAILQNTPE